MDDKGSPNGINCCVSEPLPNRSNSDHMGRLADVLMARIDRLNINLGYLGSSLQGIKSEHGNMKLSIDKLKTQNECMARQMDMLKAKVDILYTLFLYYHRTKMQICTL